MAYARDLLSDEKKTFSLLTAGALIGRPFIAPKNVPADRLAALQAAFDVTMQDPEFLADAEKQGMTVTPLAGAEVETAISKLYQTSPDIAAAAKEITGKWRRDCSRTNGLIAASRAVADPRRDNNTPCGRHA